MSESAVNTSSAVNNETKATQISCIIVSCFDEVKVKNYSDGSQGKHVTQQIKVTTEGPMKGMILPASRTTLNKKGEVSDPLAIGSKATAYLRKAKKPDGSPIVFADLGSGIPSTDVNAVINAMEAMMNASQAI